MQVTVNIARSHILLGRKTYKCASGKGAAVLAEKKTEGDGATPLGQYPFRHVFYRPDRVGAPQSGLLTAPLSPSDGWCDAPLDPLYNQRVSLPYPASHERLWRDDHVYDVIVQLGHNDNPIMPYRGSAVFMHVAKPDYSPTEGCIALALPDLLALLKDVRADTLIDIRAS